MTFPSLLLAFAESPAKRDAVQAQVQHRLQAGSPLISDHSSAQELVSAAHTLVGSQVSPLKRWPAVAQSLLKASVESVDHSVHVTNLCELVNAMARMDALLRCHRAPITQSVALWVLFDAIVDRADAIQEGPAYESFVLAFCRFILRFQLVLSKARLQKAFSVINRARLQRVVLSPMSNTMLLEASAHLGYVPAAMGISDAVSQLADAKLPWKPYFKRVIMALGFLRTRGVTSLTTDREFYPWSFVVATRRLLEGASRHVPTLNAISLKRLVYTMSSLRGAVRGWGPLEAILGRCLEQLSGLQQLDPLHIHHRYIIHMLFNLSSLQYKPPGKLVRQMVTTMLSAHPLSTGCYTSGDISALMLACFRMSTPPMPSSVVLLLRVLTEDIDNIPPEDACIAVYATAGMYADDPEVLLQFRAAIGKLTGLCASKKMTKTKVKNPKNHPLICMLLQAHHAMVEPGCDSVLLATPLLRRMEKQDAVMPADSALPGRRLMARTLKRTLYDAVKELGWFSQVYQDVRVLSGAGLVDVLGVLPDSRSIGFDVLRPPDVFINEPNTLTGPVMFKQMLMSARASCPLVTVPFTALEEALAQGSVSQLLQRLISQHPTAREMLRAAIMY